MGTGNQVTDSEIVDDMKRDRARALAELKRIAKALKVPVHSSIASGMGEVRRTVAKKPGTSVFLGGSCGKTTWRKGVMKELAESEIRYYNPQVVAWSPELAEIEAQKKEECGVNLFVITAETNSAMSMVEASHLVSRGGVVLVIDEKEWNPRDPKSGVN